MGMVWDDPGHRTPCAWIHPHRSISKGMGPGEGAWDREGTSGDGGAAQLQQLSGEGCGSPAGGQIKEGGANSESGNVNSAQGNDDISSPVATMNLLKLSFGVFKFYTDCADLAVPEEGCGYLPRGPALGLCSQGVGRVREMHGRGAVWGVLATAHLRVLRDMRGMQDSPSLSALSWVQPGQRHYSLARGTTAWPGPESPLLSQTVAIQCREESCQEAAAGGESEA